MNFVNNLETDRNKANTYKSRARFTDWLKMTQYTLKWLQMTSRNKIDKKSKSKSVTDPPTDRWTDGRSRVLSCMHMTKNNGQMHPETIWPAYRQMHATENFQCHIKVSFCRRSLLRSSKCMPSLKRHFPFSIWMNMITY